MKKKVLFTIVAFSLASLNACRYINTTEKYVDAQESKQLIIPAGVDKPNSTSTLEVPSVQQNQHISSSKKIAPPDMPIRVKQSENGKIKIASEEGYPVLTVKTDKEQMWQAMNSVSLEDWSIVDADKSTCSTTLKYIDSAANERKNSGFFKKMFRRSRNDNDYTGNYKLNCSQSDNVTQVKFSKQDNSKAPTYLADSVMTYLYGKFE